MKMQRESVTEEELQELAQQINFTIKDDNDLLKLFKEARKLGFWPEMDRPKLNDKAFILRQPNEGTPRRGNLGCLGGLPEDADYTVGRDGFLKATYRSPESRRKEKIKLMKDNIERTEHRADMAARELRERLASKGYSAEQIASLMKEIEG